MRHRVLLCERRVLENCGLRVVAKVWLENCGLRVVGELPTCGWRIVVFSVSYFLLLKNFVAAYQSLREACANSRPSTSTRCGRVAWRPLSQLTHCGLKTNKPSGVAWQPLSQLTHCGLKKKQTK